MRKYRIVYEDEDLLVVFKPAGLPTQSARATAPDLMSALANEYLERGVKNQYLGLVNRLDQPVEGLLLVGKTRNAAAGLSRQASSRTGMEKEYLALVNGKMPEKEGMLVDYLVHDRRTNSSRVGEKGGPEAKRCELSYRVLGEWKEKSLLEIRLLTGRHHQIRVQLAHRGCPIAGDQKYGPAADARAGGRLCLCACKIAFRHPRTKKTMSFQVEPTFPIPPTAP